jgi:hypothetical protein
MRKFARGVAIIALVAGVQPLYAVEDAARDAAAEHETVSHQQAGSESDDAVADAKPKEAKTVCEARASTGSIMPRRTCRTKEQVDQDEKRAREFKDQLKN